MILSFVNLTTLSIFNVFLIHWSDIHLHKLSLHMLIGVSLSPFSLSCRVKIFQAIFPQISLSVSKRCMHVFFIYSFSVCHQLLRPCISLRFLFWRTASPLPQISSSSVSRLPRMNNCIGQLILYYIVFHNISVLFYLFIKIFNSLTFHLSFGRHHSPLSARSGLGVAHFHNCPSDVRSTRDIVPDVQFSFQQKHLLPNMC